MSTECERVKNDPHPSLSYSINIKTTTSLSQPLTCYITTGDHLTKNQIANQSNEKVVTTRRKSFSNDHQSSIHLPVTYSTSVHLPCRPRPSPLISSTSSHHHHHHHYHYYYHHHRSSPRTASIESTQPTITTTSSEVIPTPVVRPRPPLPSYSGLVLNWFHQIPRRSAPVHQKGSQSDNSEVCRHEPLRKRNLLFKLFSSPLEKSRDKRPPCRPSLNRKHFELSSSSSSLPNPSTNYKK